MRQIQKGSFHRSTGLTPRLDTAADIILKQSFQQGILHSDILRSQRKGTSSKQNREVPIAKTVCGKIFWIILDQYYVRPNQSKTNRGHIDWAWQSKMAWLKLLESMMIGSLRLWIIRITTFNIIKLCTIPGTCLPKHINIALCWNQKLQGPHLHPPLVWWTWAVRSLSGQHWAVKDEWLSKTSVASSR